METDPEKGQQGHAGDLASAQDIRELLHVAEILVEPVGETYEAESSHSTPDGSICFLEVRHNDDKSAVDRAYLYVYGPKEVNEEGDDCTPLILTVGFAEEAEGPYLAEDWEENEPSVIAMQAAAEICTELLVSRNKLNDMEKAILIRVNAFLTEQIYQAGEGNHDEVQLPDGQRLKCAAAIGQAIASRSQDFLKKKVYSDNIGDAELIITKYDKSNPDIYEEFSGTTIELVNEITNEYIKLHVEENGTATVTETEDIEEDKYTEPERKHIAQLRTAVQTIYDRIFREQEEAAPREEGWRSYVTDVVQLVTQLDKLPSDAPENVTQELIDEIEAAKQRLVDDFETAYGLNRDLSDRILITSSTFASDEGRIVISPSKWVALEYTGMQIMELGIAGTGKSQNIVCVTGTVLTADGETHLNGYPLMPTSEIIKPENN